MKAGSLCTGIGGLDLAVEAFFGCELAWYSEVEKAPCTVLERHWPDVPNLGDLTAVDWAEVEPVDVLTAGYPCQPFSYAGKRQGAADDRHLWPNIAESICALRPRWVVLENVAGHLSLGFSDVLGSLAEAGFDAAWCVLRASDVGAPHQRARLFIVAADADRESTGRDGSAAPRPQEPDGGRGAAHLGDRPADGPQPLADATDLGHERPRLARGQRAGSADSGDAAPNPDGKRHEGSLPGASGEDLGSDSGPETAVAWGVYEPAIRRWERVLGRPAPAPTDDAGRLSPDFVEWMMGYPAGWVDGLSRTRALKALGNAVVPQQGYAALCELVPAHFEESAA